jgi:hypothetical protein
MKTGTGIASIQSVSNYALLSNFYASEPPRFATSPRPRETHGFADMRRNASTTSAVTMVTTAVPAWTKECVAANPCLQGAVHRQRRRSHQQ